MSHGSESTRKNRLARESSPYLLLHQDNPVDWYPWGPEALEKARREEKPIFLSVGYSTCYWCHVMERESFSDPGIAELLNRHFVSIKVDREERPDLDDVYMTATQILTNRGGWPNSVFLTPDLEPFYAGTYFPPEDRQGLPGFRSLLTHMTDAWQNRRNELEQHADEVARAMGNYFESRDKASETPPGPAAATRSLEALAKRFDAEWGGFGSAPKFPSPSNLYLLAELAEDRPKAAHMLHQTLDEMARGGIYDQLGGGFHRYSTDREWKVPHFEKMLYDNGFLLELYAREHARTGDPEMARIARETAQWIVREMTGDHGAFYSAIDAETQGKEGAFYAWTRDEMEQVLGEENATFLAPLYGFDRPPFFEDDEYVLHLPRPVDEAAEDRKMSRRELLDEMAPMRTKLFDARADRQRPLTDDKILADWNGIAVTGMAVAGRILEDDDLVDRAARAARFVLREMRPEANGGDATLLHTYRAGEAKLEAYLADYVFMIRGLLALHRATGEAEWLDAARELAREQVERLRDPEGGFYNAAPDENLLFRPKETFDGAMPAANSVAALNFLELAGRVDDPEEAVRWRREAEDTLRSFGGIVETYPDAVRMATVAAHRLGGADAKEEPDVEAARGGAAPSAAAALLAQQGLKKVVSKLRVQETGDGDWRGFTLTLEIEDGWHVNAHPASEEFLVPTDLAATGARLDDVSYPEGRPFATEFADGEISVYEGTVEITGKVLPTTDEPVLRLTFQACDAEKCLPPVTREMGLR